jgi:hypothetical protein
MPTEKALATMAKQGYIDKVRDTSTGETLHDYYLGPRGKIEVGKQGTMIFVKQVFGDEMDQDMEKRIKRSMLEMKVPSGEQPGAEPEEEVETNQSQPRRKRTRQENHDEEEGEERSRDGQSRRQADRASSPPARRRGPREVPEDEGEDQQDEEDNNAPRSRRGGPTNGVSRRSLRR